MLAKQLAFPSVYTPISSNLQINSYDSFNSYTLWRNFDPLLLTELL